MVLERRIEIGLYKYITDLEKKVLDEPLIHLQMRPNGNHLEILNMLGLSNVHAQENSPIIYYAPVEIVQAHAKPGELEHGRLVELTTRSNALDQYLAESFDVINSGDEQKTEISENLNRTLRYSQKKFCYLRPKEDRAEVSYLKIKLEAAYDNDEFRSIYLDIRLSGFLGSKESPLVKDLLYYYARGQLTIINNVITSQKPFEQLYVEESIKQLAVARFLTEAQKEAEKTYDHFIGAQNKSQAKQKQDAASRDRFLATFRKSFPVKIITEDYRER